MATSKMKIVILSEFLHRLETETEMSDDFQVVDKEGFNSKMDTKTSNNAVGYAVGYAADHSETQLTHNYALPVPDRSAFPIRKTIFNRFYVGVLVPLLHASTEQNCATIRAFVPLTASETKYHLSDSEVKKDFCNYFATEVKSKFDAESLKKCCVTVHYGDISTGGVVIVDIKRNTVSD